MTWYNPDWSYKKEITINGTYVSGSQNNLPIFFRISGIGTKSLANGTDIIFVDDDDSTRLHHELVMFSGYSGNAWIQIPSLSNETSKTLYMYYGNLTGGNQTDIDGYRASSAWDNTFLYVSHMTDVTSTTIKDSSKYANNGTKYAVNQPSMVSTPMGSGQLFKRNTITSISSQYISQYSDYISSQLTLEIWFNDHSTTSTYGYMFARSNTTDYAPWSLYTNEGTGYVRFYLNTTSGVGGTDTCAYNQFVDNYYCISWDETRGSNEAVYYLNGDYKGIGTTWHGQIQSFETNIQIGSRGDLNTERRFSGSIDEVRFHKVYRNGGWVKTCYNNISSTSVFFTVGLENEISSITTYTSFKMPIGNPLLWTWNSGQFNINNGMRATSEDGLSWTWGVASSSVNYFYKAGTPTGWVWKSGSGI